MNFKEHFIGSPQKTNVVSKFEKKETDTFDYNWDDETINAKNNSNNKTCIKAQLNKGQNKLVK